MSPPLETHGKTGSIGVDNELSILSSPKPLNSNEQNDQAMDLFLNQVAEYNAQQLSFDQHHASSSKFSLNLFLSSSNPFLNKGMDPSQVLAAQQQYNVKQEETTKPEQPKKGKQKSKDNSHSLLHVIPTENEHLQDIYI